MQTTQKRTGRLRAIREARPQCDARLQQLTDAAWNFAYTLQWNGEIFSETETRTAKEAIASFLKLHPTPEKGFSVFCQRTVLAQNGLSRILYQSGILPSQWFDWRNDEGFVSTKAEFDRIEKTRASLPLHRQCLHQLADAVLSFAENPAKENLLHWKGHFAAAKSQHLFVYLLAAAANQIFN